MLLFTVRLLSFATHYTYIYFSLIMIFFWSKATSALKASFETLTHRLERFWGATSNTDMHTWKEGLEETLIEADIPPTLALSMAEALAKERFPSFEAMAQALFTMLVARFTPLQKALPLTYGEDQPWVVMVLGVNGGGKTTTIGKLAAFWKAQGQSCLIVPGDTFRVAAKEQLEQWTKRAGAIILESTHKDPAAMAVEGVLRAKKEGFTRVLMDTSGRLPNQTPLMEELRKISSALSRHHGRHENILIVDATLGQSAKSHVALFQEVVPLSGIFITKWDGSAKAGATAFAALEAGLAIYGMGTGEKIEDWVPFEAESFVKTLLT